jgi:hypothetical protein
MSLLEQIKNIVSDFHLEKGGKHLSLLNIIIITILSFYLILFIGCSKKSNPVAPVVTGKWTYCQGLPNDLHITGFAASGNNIVAGTFSAGASKAYIYISFDNGAIWSLDTTFSVDTKSKYTHLFSGAPVTFLNYGGYFFAGIGGAYRGAIFRSIDNGITWSDKGITWPENDSSFSEDINCFSTIGTNIFAGTEHGVFKSTDLGASWVTVNNGFPIYPSTGWPPQALHMVSNGTDLFVGGTSGDCIFLSTNSAANWTAVNTGLPNSPHIYGLETTGSKVFAGIFNYGVYVTTDNGSSWSAVNNGLISYTINGQAVFPVDALASYGNYLFAGTNYGLCVSTNIGTTWNNISAGTPIDSTVIGTIAVINSQLFAGYYGAWRYPVAALPALIKK